MGPSTWTQVLTTALFVLPGFVCRGVRARLRGPHPDDRELPTRVFRSLAVSVVFDLIYLAALGGLVTTPVRNPTLLLAAPQGYAAAALLLIFVVPAVVGVLAHAWYLSSAGVVNHWWEVRGDELSLYDNTPTAWDYGFRYRDDQQFVRVLTPDNLWIGGLADHRLFATAYPEKRGIYVPVAFEMADDGSFGEQIENTAGMWINCEDAKVVQFVKNDDSSRDDQAAVAHTEAEGGGQDGEGHQDEPR